MKTNREILLSRDFTSDFADELCAMLEELIDFEFEKNEETDFDFIDECANAINAIRSGNAADAIPVISRKEFINKLKRSGGKRAMKLVAAACMVLVTASGVAAFTAARNGVDITYEASSLFASVFGEEEKTLSSKTTTDNEICTDAEVITDIELKTNKSFKTEYAVGESFSAEGLEVFAVTENNKKIKLKKGEYSFGISPDFANEEGKETVTVSFGEHRKTIEVRVLRTAETKVLTSIYAVFPDDFNFTVDDITTPKAKGMKVLAVYSDKSERELNENEYTVLFEDDSDVNEKKVFVTVEYRDCSCSFMLFEESRE